MLQAHGIFAIFLYNVSDDNYVDGDGDSNDNDIIR
jgi:hypothetical protein